MLDTLVLLWNEMNQGLNNVKTLQISITLHLVDEGRWNPVEELTSHGIDAAQ